MKFPKWWGRDYEAYMSERTPFVFKGFVGLPVEMTDEQLEEYTIWITAWMKEYCVEDGRRINSYNQVENAASSYFEELERRKKKK